MGVTPARILPRLIAPAVWLGADTLEVEYRDGYREVSAMKRGLGVGIARFPSGEAQATSLREELLTLRKRKAKVIGRGAQYEIRTRTYDSFGETAFEVRLRRI